MSSTAIRQAPSLEAAQALARHLLEHPDAAARPAGELAGDFGLDATFVDEVLRGVHKAPKEVRQKNDWYQSVPTLLTRAFDAAIHRPTMFVTLLTLLYCLPVMYFVIAEQASVFRPSAFAAWSFVGLCAIQQACFYRRAQIRHALYGGLVFWLLLSMTFVVILWAKAPDRSSPELPATMFAISIALMLLAVIYSSIGSFFAVLGGYARIRKDEKADSTLTRQELLRRLFEIQERMRTCEVCPPYDARSLIPDSVTRAFNRSPYAFSILGNFVLTLATILAFHFSTVTLEPKGPASSLAYVVQLVTFLAAVIFSIAISYLAGGFIRATLLNLVSMAICLPLLLLPISPFGMEAAPALFAPWQITFKVGLMVALSALGSLGAVVEARTIQAQRLKENDPAALLAEMVRLEWRLNVRANEVCIVVVDAAKSAEMKANSDPLVAEFSFREYQKFLANTCVQNGGTVHSTAGDGAVLAFPRCDQALAAAKEIQTGISYFNEHVNRMAAKFRLRIGLHMGSLTGELCDVQYTEVIDIAAHVQAAAPVRGILMTKCVAEHLPDEHLIPLKDAVDGYEVLLAYNPTVDA